MHRFCVLRTQVYIAQMAKLVDAYLLDGYVKRRAGSSPALRTIRKNKMNAPFFKCTKCGAPHIAILVQRGSPNLTDEERSKLRAVWHASIDRLNRPNLSSEQIKTAEENESKNSAAYLNTIVWDFWKVPEELVSIKDASVHRLECQSHQLEKK